MYLLSKHLHSTDTTFLNQLNLIISNHSSHPIQQLSPSLELTHHAHIKLLIRRTSNITTPTGSTTQPPNRTRSVKQLIQHDLIITAKVDDGRTITAYDSTTKFQCVAADGISYDLAVRTVFFAAEEVT
jgi:hypothetical protein